MTKKKKVEVVDTSETNTIETVRLGFDINVGDLEYVIQGNGRVATIQTPAGQILIAMNKEVMEYIIQEHANYQNSPETNGKDETGEGDTNLQEPSGEVNDEVKDSSGS